MKPKRRKRVAILGGGIREHRHLCLCAERAFSLLTENGLQACLAHRLGSLCSVTATKLKDGIAFIRRLLQSRNLTADLGKAITLFAAARPAGRDASLLPAHRSATHSMPS